MPITFETIFLGLIIIAILFLVGGLVKGNNRSRNDDESKARRASSIRARAGAHLRQMNAPTEAVFAGPGFSPGPLGGEPQGYAPPQEDQRLPMNWEDVDPQIRTALERKVAALPTLPTMTTNLVAMLQDPETEPKEIAKVAATDPAIATEIIRAINSAYFALREPCNDLDRSILLLGYNWVKFLVIRMSMTKSTKNDPAYEKRLSSVWRRSFMTSECVTSIIRNYTRLDQVAEASTAALLHDLGRLVELNVPNSEQSVSSQIMLDSATIPPDKRVFVEEDLFGVNHCLVGGIVAEHLSLTQLVRSVQLYHHHPVNAIWNLPLSGEVIQIIAAVKLADNMVFAFEEQRNPQPKIMTGLMDREPDIAAYRPFFPNLPDFPILMGFLEPELQRSVSFLSTFLPDSTPAPPMQQQPQAPTPAPKTRYADRPPEDGNNQPGDLVYNTNQQEGGPMGWVCIQAGSPGVWRTFGGDPLSEAEGQVAGGAAAADTGMETAQHALAEAQEVHAVSRDTNPPLRLIHSESSAPASIHQATETQPEHSVSADDLPLPETHPQESAARTTEPSPESSGVSSSEPEIPQTPEEEENYRDLFESYLKAKASLGEDVSTLNYAAFATSIARQAQAQRQSSGSRVAFRVITRDGRVLVVGRRVATNQAEGPV